MFDHGLAVLRDWGLRVREYPSTRAERDDPARDPRARAADVNAAFADPGVAAITGVVAGELGRPDLPILAELPFGHTDPQWVLPLGVRAELDADAGTLALVEPWLA